ncbi:MAG: hypothetical protein P8177_12840 [Gemmatimonadota bacterium]|jgi:hypothetical protein
MLQRTTLAAVALAAVTACASTGQVGDDSLPGCYYFEQDDVHRSLRLPWGVRLAPEALDGWPALQQRDGVRVATTLTTDGDADHPFGYWLPLASDSLEIGYPGGGGYTLRLAVEGQRLEGTARPVGDVRAPGQESLPAPSPVALTRALCPEE